jgi:hypothetical protein
LFKKEKPGEAEGVRPYYYEITLFTGDPFQKRRSPLKGAIFHPSIRQQDFRPHGNEMLAITNPAQSPDPRLDRRLGFHAIPPVHKVIADSNIFASPRMQHDSRLEVIHPGHFIIIRSDPYGTLQSNMKTLIATSGHDAPFARAGHDSCLP